LHYTFLTYLESSGHDHAHGIGLKTTTGLGQDLIRDLELADDLVLLASLKEDIQVFLARLKRCADHKRLTVSPDKTQVMVFFSGRSEVLFQVGRTALQVVMSLNIWGSFHSQRAHDKGC
jgi:hypothetical protein